MQTFKRGDVVSVKGTVRWDPAADDTYVYLRLEGGGSETSVKMEDVTLVQARFDVGEEVRYQRARATIKAIVGDHAWIEYADGPQEVVPLRGLERVPAPLPVEEMYRAPTPAEAVQGAIAEDENIDPAFRRALDMATWEVAEGKTTINEDGSLTPELGPFRKQGEE